MNDTSTMSGRIQTGMDEARNTAGKLKEAAKDTLHDVGDAASHALDRAQKSVRAAEKSMEACIRDQPLRSVLIAAGLGILLGRLFIK